MATDVVKAALVTAPVAAVAAVIVAFVSCGATKQAAQINAEAIKEGAVENAKATREAAQTHRATMLDVAQIQRDGMMQAEEVRARKDLAIVCKGDQACFEWMLMLTNGTNPPSVEGFPLIIDPRPQPRPPLLVVPPQERRQVPQPEKKVVYLEQCSQRVLGRIRFSTKGPKISASQERVYVEAANAHYDGVGWHKTAEGWIFEFTILNDGKKPLQLVDGSVHLGGMDAPGARVCAQEAEISPGSRGHFLVLGLQSAASDALLVRVRDVAITGRVSESGSTQ